MAFLYGGHIQCVNGDFWCRLCSRYFYSRGAVLAHCRTTRNHEWCDSCERVFATDIDKVQHLETSPNHHICYACEDPVDFKTEAQLDEHLKEEHFWCCHCDRCNESKEDLEQHLVSEHFSCLECQNCFSNENKLRQHKKIHESKKLQCSFCERPFARFSFLLLHLERSRCFSFNRLKEIVFDTRDSYHFTTTFSDPTPFVCLNCNKRFTHLSGLFQHVEDAGACSVLLQDPEDLLQSLADYICSELEDY